MASVNKVYKFCLHCGRKFYRPYRYSFKDWESRKYCCCECYRKSRVGERSRNWRGGRKINYQGYILIYKPRHIHADSTGYVSEHILVVTKYINRSLLYDEVVHHKNGIKTDNRIENLELLKRGEHISYHQKGRKLSETTKRKISDIRKKRIPFIIREANGQFKKGVTYGI